MAVVVVKKPSTIRAAWQAAFAAHDRRPIHEWASDALTLPPVLTKAGRFDPSGSRHFLAPLDALSDPRVREVNVLAPPRSGKSLLADLFAPWTIANDPGPFLWVFQDEAMAKSYAKTRALLVLKSSRAVRELLPHNRFHDTTLEILFTNGLPFVMTGPALSNLQSRGFRYVVIDEPWVIAREHPGRMLEAKARLGDFIKLHTSKLLCLSQGGAEGDDWAEQFASGNLHEWQTACDSCSKPFAPLWEGIRSDGSRWGIRYESVRDASNRRNLARAVETLRFECPHCGHPHLDTPRTKGEWNRLGQYVSDPSGNPRRVSFHWNNLIDYPWAELVEQWIAARNAYDTGYHAPVIAFYQKNLAKHYDPSHAAVVYQLPAIEVQTEKDKAWPKQDVIFLTVDVQRDHFWALVTAWSNAGELCIVSFEKLYSWSSIAETQTRFNIPDQCVFVDCGDGLRQQEIYSECAQHGHKSGNHWRCWWALRGSDKGHFPDGTRKDKRTGHHPMLPYSWPAQPGDPCLGLHRDDPRRAELRGKACPVVTWSNPAIKGIAAVRRDEITKGVRTFIKRGEWNDELSAHLHAESPKQVADSLGHTKWRWERIGRRPNHGWDCFCMALVAACMRGILGDIVTREV